MAHLLVAALLALALFGHAALWVSVVNRLNSLPIHHRVMKALNYGLLLLCAVVGAALAAWAAWTLLARAGLIAGAASGEALPPGQIASVYAAVCCAVGGWAIACWLRRRMTDASRFVRANHTRHVNVEEATGRKLAASFRARVAARIPANGAFDLRVHTKEVLLPKLPAQLDGLSITHLSDIHMAEHLRREYFDEVIRQARQLAGDIVAVTGDIVDRPWCLDWLDETLGRLQPPHGAFFILGNHDMRRTDADEVRAKLTQCGLVDLGGGYAVLNVSGAQVLMVGSELPWLKPPPSADALPVSPRAAGVLSILLSHTPDQFAWARRHGFDLMLAGHTHGGQVRLPLVGPVLAPSRYGVKYCGGTYLEPPTLLHVSRGINSMMPLRINCPPEVTKLVLRRAI